MKVFNICLGTLIAIAILWVLGTEVVEQISKSGTLCNWCDHYFQGEGHQLREFWLDDRCEDGLSWWSGTILDKRIKGNSGWIEAWDPKRRAWQYEMVKERQDFLKWKRK